MAPGKKPPLRHYLQFRDLSRAEYEHLFARTRWIKDRFKRYQRYWPLEDRTLAMIFEKQSTRTRLSFEAGMHQLGGTRDLPQYARFAARPRRAGGGRRAGDLAHVRPGDDPHLRPEDHRALRGPLPRAGDQRPHQPVPPLPDPRGRLHLHRAPRRDPGQDGGLDRRLEQHVQHLAAGGGNIRLQAERVDAARLRAQEEEIGDPRILRRPGGRRPGRGPRSRPTSGRRWASNRKTRSARKPSPAGR